MRKIAYIWYPPADRAAHALRLKGIGCEEVRLKAGGDDGRLWEQWADTRVAESYRREGLRVTPWFYTWPTMADIDVVARAMRAQAFDEYSLNPEVEWRTDSNRNPWRNISEANAGAADWLRRMELALPSVRRGFSGVPSWVGFPYEAWCAGCQFAEPQHYWPKNLLANVYGHDYDQVGYHALRGGSEIDCYPIITASREYLDPAVVALAKTALAEYPTIDGMSCWEAGNAAFQWDAMRQVYALLPDNVIVVPGPDNQWARSWVDPQTGVPHTQIAWGGQATEVLGTDYQDVGITVAGVPDGDYVRSIQRNQFQPWVRIDIP